MASHFTERKSQAPHSGSLGPGIAALLPASALTLPTQPRDPLAAPLPGKLFCMYLSGSSLPDFSSLPLALSREHPLSHFVQNCISCFSPTFLLVPPSLLFSSTALTTMEQGAPSHNNPGSSATHVEAQKDGVFPVPGTAWHTVGLTEDVVTLLESSVGLPDPVRNVFPIWGGLEIVPLKQHAFTFCSLSLPSLRGGEVSASPSGRTPWNHSYYSRGNTTFR